MRLVSKNPGLGLGTFQKETFVLALDGQRDKTKDSISVTFGQEELLSTDIRWAVNHWAEKEFTGRWLDADGVTLQPVAERIGVFDTRKQGWDDELRERVEAWLLAKPNYGLDFTQVQLVAGDPPWPTYPTTHHFKVADLAAENGLVHEALAYEQATKKRASVLESLEAKVAELAETPAEGELILA